MRHFSSSPRARIHLFRRVAVFSAGICCLLPLVGCAPTSPPAAIVSGPDVVTLDVGGVAVKFAPLPGFCMFPADLYAEGRQLVDGAMQELVVLASVADCGQLDAAQASLAPVSDDAYVAAPKDLLETNLGDDRAGFVRVMAAELRKTKIDEAIGAAQGRIADDLKTKEVDMEISGTTSLGIVEQDRDAVYFAAVQTGKLDSSAVSQSFSRLTVGAATLLRGRAILIYFSADYEPDHPLDAVLARCKAQVERLISLNPSGIDS